MSDLLVCSEPTIALWSSESSSRCRGLPEHSGAASGFYAQQHRNKLPELVRSALELDSFKSGLETFLFAGASNKK
jgi:hypothetical protein